MLTPAPGPCGCHGSVSCVTEADTQAPVMMLLPKASGQRTSSVSLLSVEPTVKKNKGQQLIISVLSKVLSNRLSNDPGGAGVVRGELVWLWWPWWAALVLTQHCYLTSLVY